MMQETVLAFNLSVFVLGGVHGRLPLLQCSASFFFNVWAASAGLGTSENALH